MPNAALTAVRAEAKELKALAEHMAGLIGGAKGPVMFFVPLKGFSAHDSDQGYLHDPSLPPVFSEHLKRVMPLGVPVVELDCHINDEPFADAIIERVRVDSAPAAGRVMALTDDDVRVILKLLDASAFGELELETDEFRLTLRRTGAGGWTQK